VTAAYVSVIHALWRSSPKRTTIKAKDVKRKPRWVRRKAYKRRAMTDRITFSRFRPCHIFENPALPALLKTFMAISRRESRPRDRLAMNIKKPGPGEERVPVPSAIA